MEQSSLITPSAAIRYGRHHGSMQTTEHSVVNVISWSGTTSALVTPRIVNSGWKPLAAVLDSTAPNKDCTGQTVWCSAAARLRACGIHCLP